MAHALGILGKAKVVIQLKAEKLFERIAEIMLSMNCILNKQSIKEYPHSNCFPL